MAEFLKQYQVTIETIGPLFIGAGKQLRKNEYILEGKRLYPIDEVKLMALLKRYNLLDKFVKDYKTKLADWLKKESVNSEELANLGKYELDCRAVEKGTLERDIQLFMKDWQGKPYVPGSSLKGALRTVLLGSEVMQNRGAYGRLAQEVERKANKEGKGINRESKKLEEMVFGKVVGVKEERVIRDTLSGLRVSDSRPLEVTDLTLCQKIDVGVDGREEFVKLVRECIRPGTKIIFDLTIDTYQCDIDGEKIMEAVNLFLAQYN
ncbi:MAG: type III-A CRISPR-associated RAMP protein Csm5, partial [Anaerovoracaceae bacterium]